MHKTNRILLVFFFLFVLFIHSVKSQKKVSGLDANCYSYFVKTQNISSSEIKSLMADTLLNMARKVDDKKMQCIAMTVKMRETVYLERINQAYRLLDKYKPFMIKNKYPVYYFTSWIFIIEYYLEKKDFEKALKEIDSFQKEAFNMNDSYGIAKSYNQLSNCYLRQGRNDLACFFSKKVIEENKKRNYVDATDCATYAQCLNLTGNYDEAIKYYKLALAQRDITIHFTLDCLSSLIRNYCMQGDSNSASLDSAFTKYIGMKNNVKSLPVKFQKRYQRTIFKYYSFKKDYKNAFKYYYADNDSVSSYNRLAELYDGMQDYINAIENYKKAIEYLQNNNGKEDNDRKLLDNYVLKADYDKMLRKNDSIKFVNTSILLEKAKEHELLLLTQERNNELEINQQKSLIKQKDLQIKERNLVLKQQKKDLLQKEKDILQQKELRSILKKKLMWRNLFYISLTMMIIIIFLNRYRLYKKRERQLIIDKEKAEKSEKDKSIFLQNMSHEIRTPLNAIVGFNEALNSDMASEFTKEEKEEMIKMININSELLTTLVNDVLDLSKFESGTYKVIKKDINIDEICHAIVETIRPRVEENVAFKYIPGSVDLVINTDGQRLQQVLINYLTNACKYTHQGSITLSYRVDDNNIIFSVADTGCGIKSEDVENCFLRFKMLDKAVKGTGLGLHICRIIANLLGGKAYVDTSYTKGACFVFELPIN